MDREKEAADHEKARREKNIESYRLIRKWQRIKQKTGDGEPITEEEAEFENGFWKMMEQRKYQP